jgi:hypothetical protein
MDVSGVMPQQVSIQGKTLQYLWDKQLGGPESWSGYGGKKEESAAAVKWTPILWSSSL